MRTANDLLREKGTQVFTIEQDATVYEALQLMAEKNVGALLVKAEGRFTGLISERDYARKVVLKGKFSKNVPVSEIMTAELVRIGPDENVEGCMARMTHKHVRHLPVFDGEQLLGIISIGDIVKAIIEHKEEIIEQLENYIKGTR